MNKIEITNVNYQNFPEIQVDVRILDEKGSPVQNISENDLIVEENGRAVYYNENGQRNPSKILSLDTGSKIALVLDLGMGIEAAGATKKARFDEMMEISSRFIQSMSPDDTIEIVVVSGKNAVIWQPLSSDANALSSRLGQLTAASVNGFSNGLLGVETAVADLKNSSGQKTDEVIVLITPGIQEGLPDDFPRVRDQAINAGIPVNIIQTNSEYSVDKLAGFATRTGGRALFYDSPSRLDDLFASIALLGQQYRISYHTDSTSSSQRVLFIKSSSDSASAPSTQVTYVIDPAPQPAAVSSMLINNGEPVQRQAETPGQPYDDYLPSEVMVQVEIGWEDAYPPRNIAWVEMLVDGTVEGQRVNFPGEYTIQFPWDLRKFREPGDQTATVQVQGEDDMGTPFFSDVTPFMISVVPPPVSDPCADSKLPVWACKSANYLGRNIPGLIALILAVPALVLTVSIGRNPSRARETFEGVKEFVTHTLRIDNRKMTPKAYLMLVNGETGLAVHKTVFPIYGTTKIGRVASMAGGQQNLCFPNPMISSLHCTILEEGEEFKIRDEASANGTYVSDDVVKSDPSNPDAEDCRLLHQDDVISLGPVESGSLAFRFTYNKPDEQYGDPTNRY